MTTNATVAGAATISQAHDASDHARHTTPPKLGTIRMKLLARVSPPIPEYSFRESWLHTDGARWAAYEPVLGTTRLIDTKTGRSIDRPDPEGCAGGLYAAGGGELLYDCMDPECPGQVRSCKTPAPNAASEYESQRYVVEDIESGGQHVVVGTSHVSVSSGDGGFSLNEIGSQWAVAASFCDECKGIGQFFLNWHTGHLVWTFEELAHPFHEALDLNLEGLLQPLCSPLRWSKTDFFFGYEPPLAVTGVELPYPGARRAPLRIVRCGSQVSELLPGGSSPHSVQLGGGLVSWVGLPITNAKSFDSSETMYVTRLRTHHRPWHGKYYRIVAPKLAHRNILLQHTSTTVFVTAAGTSNTNTEIYYARIPSK